MANTNYNILWAELEMLKKQQQSVAQHASNGLYKSGNSVHMRYILLQCKITTANLDRFRFEVRRRQTWWNEYCMVETVEMSLPVLLENTQAKDQP